jgi:TRAP-type transport system periplasmic protein
MLKYFSPLNVTFATDMVTVNLKAFQKLSKAQQTALVKIGKEMEVAMWASVKTWDKEQEANCNKNGIETIKPSEKVIGELVKIAENIRAEWLKNGACGWQQDLP